VASLLPLCIGTLDRNVQKARIYTADTNTGKSLFHPASPFDGLALSSSGFEIFWFVNDSSIAIVNQHIVDVRRWDNGLPINKLFFSTKIADVVVLQWNWEDMAGLTTHASASVIPILGLTGTWWHSILTMFPGTGQTGNEWRIYHGRTGVNVDGTLGPSDSMPYPITATLPMTAGAGAGNPQRLAGFRPLSLGNAFPIRIAFGGQRNAADTGWVASGDLDGGFAECRLSGSFIRQDPIPGNPPTPAEFERRRNIYVIHADAGDASNEGVGSEVIPNYRNIIRFNEPPGTAVEDYQSVGSRQAHFDNEFNEVSGGGFSSSPILTPVGGTAVTLIGTPNISLSSEVRGDLLRAPGFGAVSDLAQSSEAAVDLLRRKDLDVVADTSLGSEQSVGTLIFHRMQIVDAGGVSTDSTPTLLMGATFSSTDLALATEAAQFKKSMEMGAIVDSSLASETLQTLLKSGVVFLNPTADLGASSEAALDFAIVGSLFPTTDDAVSTEGVLDTRILKEMGVVTDAAASTELPFDQVLAGVVLLFPLTDLSISAEVSQLESVHRLVTTDLSDSAQSSPNLEFVRGLSSTDTSVAAELSIEFSSSSLVLFVPLTDLSLSADTAPLLDRARSLDATDLAASAELCQFGVEMGLFPVADLAPSGELSVAFVLQGLVPIVPLTDLSLSTETVQFGIEHLLVSVAADATSAEAVQFGIEQKFAPTADNALSSELTIEFTIAAEVPLTPLADLSVGSELSDLSRALFLSPVADAAASSEGATDLLAAKDLVPVADNALSSDLPVEFALFTQLLFVPLTDLSVGAEVAALSGVVALVSTDLSTSADTAPDMQFGHGLASTDLSVGSELSIQFITERTLPFVPLADLSLSTEVAPQLLVSKELDVVPDDALSTEGIPQLLASKELTVVADDAVSAELAFALTKAGIVNLVPTAEVVTATEVSNAFSLPTMDLNVVTDLARSSEPGTGGTAPPPAIPGPGIVISVEEIQDLPVTGAGWDNIVLFSDSSFSGQLLVDENNDLNLLITLACALRFARQGDTFYRDKAAGTIITFAGESPFVIPTPDVDAYARHAAGYAIAYDILDNAGGLTPQNRIQAESNFDLYRTFSGWTGDPDPQSLISAHLHAPDERGHFAGASRMATDLFAGLLGDFATDPVTNPGTLVSFGPATEVALRVLGQGSPAYQFPEIDYGGILGLNNSWQAEPYPAFFSINRQGTVLGSTSTDGFTAALTLDPPDWWWKADEALGATVLVNSGTMPNGAGSFGGGAAPGAPGILSNQETSVDFDLLVPSWLESTNSLGWKTTIVPASWSIFCWINLDVLPVVKQAIWNRNSFSKLEVFADGSLVLQRTDAATGLHTATAPPGSIVAGTDYLIFSTFLSDTIDPDRGTVLWIDGVKVGQSTNIGGTNLGGVAFFVGTLAAGGGGLDGRMQQIGMWSTRFYTGAEQVALFAAGQEILGTGTPRSVDGAQPEEMGKLLAYSGDPWPVPGITTSDSPYRALQGLLLQVLILEKQGFGAKLWGDSALLRAFDFLWTEQNFPITPLGTTSNDTWMTYAINHLYGTSYTEYALGFNSMGHNFGFTDWLYAGLLQPPFLAFQGFSVDRGMVADVVTSLSSELPLDVDVRAGKELFPTADLSLSSELAVEVLVDRGLLAVTDLSLSADVVVPLLVTEDFVPVADLSLSSDGAPPELLRDRALQSTDAGSVSSETALLKASDFLLIGNEVESGSAFVCNLEDYLSKLDIWNFALTKLGIETLTATTDAVSQAVAMADNWDLFKRSFLRDHFWNGANTTKALVTFKDNDGVTAVIPAGPWSLAYSLSLSPEWIRSIKLNGLENRPGPKSRSGLGLWTEATVFNDVGTGQFCLLTNESSAVLEYTFHVLDNDLSTYMPADMQAALALSFAVHMASDLGSNNVDVRQLEEQAEISRRNARRTDAQSGSKFTYTDTTIADSFY